MTDYEVHTISLSSVTHSVYLYNREGRMIMVAGKHCCVKIRFPYDHECFLLKRIDNVVPGDIVVVKRYDEK